MISKPIRLTPALPVAPPAISTDCPSKLIRKVTSPTTRKPTSAVPYCEKPAKTSPNSASPSCIASTKRVAPQHKTGSNSTKPITVAIDSKLASVNTTPTPSHSGKFAQVFDQASDRHSPISKSPRPPVPVVSDAQGSTLGGT